jgi:hypothetical protein
MNLQVPSNASPLPSAVVPAASCGQGARSPEAALLSPGRLPALVAAIAVFGLVQALMLPMNSDVAWLLYAGGQVLDGARLGVDVVEVNPPLIVYLNAAVEGISRLAGVSSLIGLPLCVVALVGVSLAMCHRLRDALPPALGQVAILVLAYMLMVYTGPMIGQREHLLVILILPYAYAAAIVARGGRISLGMAIASGVMAAVGFALKPFFVLALVGVELYLVRRRGGRILLRPQAVAMAIVLALYAAALVVFTPEYFTFVWRWYAIYRAYQPYQGVLRAGTWRLGVLAAAVLGAHVLLRGRASEWARIMIVLALMLTLGVYLQGKGFLYHWYPAIAITAVLLALAVTAAFLRWWPRRWVLRPEFALALAVPLACLDSNLSWSGGQYRDLGAYDIVRKYAKDDAIGVLSTYVYTVFPMVNETGVRWASRYSSLWQIPGFYQAQGWTHYRTPEEMSELERALVDSVAADLERTRPAILFVDKSPPTPAMEGFDYQAYLAASPRFARILEDYRFLVNTANYRVLERKRTR